MSFNQFISLNKFFRTNVSRLCFLLWWLIIGSFSTIFAQSVSPNDEVSTNNRITAPLDIVENSRVWLDGTSNVVDFSCITHNILVDGSIIGLDTTTTIPGGHHGLQISIKIPVNYLDCGRPGINRDMRETLNARRHQYINYSLNTNRLLGAFHDDAGSLLFEIDTTGDLEISGKKRDERIRVTGEFLGPWHFRIRGSHSILLSDYDLTPPSPMMGLIKVSDRMMVHFDVTLTIAE